jgi:hypothetical protein
MTRTAALARGKQAGQLGEMQMALSMQSVVEPPFPRRAPGAQFAPVALLQFVGLSVCPYIK